MPFTVFCCLLAAAALHAGWNVLIRAALFAAVLLPWLPPIRPACRFYLLASTGIHVSSYVLTGRAYREADLSQVYPLMRGIAPLLTTLAAMLWLHDPLSWRAIGGIVLTCAGVAAILRLRARLRWSRGLGFALANAAAIAGYSTIDGAGARLSQAPASYAAWVFLASGGVWLGRRLARQGSAGVRYLCAAGWRGPVGGIGSVLAYGTALWAMTRAPVAVVAALRECSIVFGMLMAACWLHERPGPRRWLGAGLIVAGAMLLRLA